MGFEMQSAVLISAWIPNPTALPFGRLAQRGGASTGKSQQRFIRVSPKGMGKKAPQEDGEEISSLTAYGKRYSRAPIGRMKEPSARNEDIL